MSPQLLNAFPRQHPVLKHCCCSRMHMVDAQSERPVFAAQTTVHLLKTFTAAQTRCDLPILRRFGLRLWMLTVGSLSPSAGLFLLQADT